jgi:hypothetical protein
MGGSSSSSDSEDTVRFASYIESKHKSAIQEAVTTREKIIEHSPYAGYSSLSADDAFFGIGFMVSSFPSLYDTFGKNLAGLDIDSLFTSAVSAKMSDSEDVLRSELALIDDSIEQMQEHKLSARDLNATNGSTFLMGSATIEQNRITKTTDFRIAIRYGLIAGVVSSWTGTLSWNEDLVKRYAQSLRDYYLCRVNADDFGYKTESNDTLWPITVLDFERNMLAAMTGSRASKAMTEKERSNISKAFLVASHTATGAQVGSMFGPYGTIVGGAVGFVVGMAVMLLE